MTEVTFLMYTSLIMRPVTYSAQDLVSFLRREKIATISQLKDALGTSADATVFRKLKELSYRTSYSHRGGYYTLDEIARFSELGLWSFREVWFSQYGTLLSTAQGCVNESVAGYFADELQEVLHVEVRTPVLKLVREERIARQKVVGKYLYCASDPALRRRQIAARQVHLAEVTSLGFGAGIRVVPDELKAAIILFFSLLDEKQRRLYAGLESLKLGHGGDRQIAQLLHMDPGTVAKGRRHLLQRDVEIDRTRRKGGGRVRIEKKLPK